MKAVAEDFEQRLAEIDRYLKFLEAAQDPDNIILQGKGRRLTKLDPELPPILKASAYLMLYNAVESTVRQGLDEVYRQIDGEGLAYSELSPRLRRVFLDQRVRTHHAADPMQASLRKALEVVNQIADAVMQQDAVKLALELRGWGTLDSARIKELFEDHGIWLRHRIPVPDKDALREVKDSRNKLSHGEHSFAEVGRTVSVADLKRLRGNVKRSVGSLLTALNGFVDAKDYAHSTSPRAR